MVKRRANKSDLEKFWRQAIERQKASGLSIRAFCDAEGLKDHQFWYWERTLKARDRAAGVSKPGRNRTRQSGMEQSKVQAPSARKRKPVVQEQTKKAVKYWSAILEEWQQSGVSLIQFANEKGIRYKTLCRWKSKLRDRFCDDLSRARSAQTDAVWHDFAPVRLIGEQDQAPRRSNGDGAKTVVEVVLNCGRVIRVPADCPLDFLTAVVSAVEVN